MRVQLEVDEVTYIVDPEINHVWVYDTLTEETKIMDDKIPLHAELIKLAQEAPPAKD